MRLSNPRLVLPFLLAALFLFLLMSNGSAQARPWIGIYMQDVTPELAEAFDLKSSYGVVINDIARILRRKPLDCCPKTSLSNLTTRKYATPICSPNSSVRVRWRQGAGCGGSRREGNVVHR